MFEHIASGRAHALMAEGYVYIDVRSTAEFSQGHPAGAKNVPILEPDPQTGAMVMNPEFLPVIEASFGKDDKLLVGCQMGGRSASACALLHQAGFSNLKNVAGGFGGSNGQPGWQDLGLPLSCEGGTYESLRSKL